MPFIGIIAKTSDSNFIKNEILKNSTSNKFEVINLKKENISNLKSVRFDTIIISEDSENLIKDSKYLEEIIKNSKYIIINSDAVKILNEINNSRMITYGLNRNAMITASSISSESVLICIQNKIENCEGRMIEEQEVSVNIPKNSLRKIYNLMAIFAVFLIYGTKN